MYDYLLKLFFLNVKYILYFTDKVNNRINFFLRFILMYSSCAVCLIFKNYLNNSNVSSLFSFRTIS